MIYLDHAAATPMDPRVLDAMLPYFSKRFFNPSATYLAAESVRKDLEAARKQIGQLLGARPNELIFTAGGTEANNLVIRGVLEQFPGARVAVSAVEHESVLKTAQHFDYYEVPVSTSGIIDVKALESAIDDTTILVSVMYANNEVGSIQPIRQVAGLLATIKKARRQAGNELPLYLHTDAAQAAAYLDLHVARLGVDFMTLNGGKIYGPKQSGLLYAASHTRFTPQILGGGQERGHRSGTENVAGAIGLATALQLVQDTRHEETSRLQNLQNLFITLLEERIPTVVINGSRKNRLPNNVHITVPGVDNERIIIALDEAGIACAAGSACSASYEEPSHVLRAMGLHDTEAQASLRFSMGQQTDESAVRRAVDLLTSLI